MFKTNPSLEKLSQKN